MKHIVSLALLSAVMASPVWAAQSLHIAYPPKDYKTVSDQISFIGTAPTGGEVLLNGKAIARSPSGHFAPRLPLKMGENLFTFTYKNEEVKLTVTRVAGKAETPKGIEFSEGSLTPSVDIARMPGELICFGAIAPAKANVSVKLDNQTIPLSNQNRTVDLPANSAALTNNNEPLAVAGAGQYLGCAIASATAAELGRPVFELTGNNAAGQPVSVSQAGPGKVEILSPANLQVAEVTAEAGVARTGPSTDYSRLTPLPKGTKASITGREGEWLRLDYGGWINSKEVNISSATAPPRTFIRSITSRQVPGATEFVFPLQVQVPMVVQQGDRSLVLTLYNTTAQTDIIRLPVNPIIAGFSWQQVMPGMVQYTFNMKSQQQWGYKLRYEGTSLILTLRHPPTYTKLFGKPLNGIKILLDPGHGGEDSGAPGPTGYPEKQVTLTMAKLLANELIARGATVYLTREEDKAVSLQERVTMIDKVEPAIALSIHYNSLPDDGDMVNTQGMGTFWYHPQAYSLAVWMHNHVVQHLGRPSYGVFWDNLALARPASAPSVLLELGFMSNPSEFEWVVNPEEQRKLAVALAEGISQWFEVASRS